MQRLIEEFRGEGEMALTSRQARIGAALLGLAGSLVLPVAVNVATDSIPDRWRPYFWIAWPVAVLTAVILVWFSMRRPAEAADSTSGSVQINNAADGGTVHAVQHGNLVIRSPDSE